MDLQKSEGIRKRNSCIDIPPNPNIQDIDLLIEKETDEANLKGLKQQKRLLRNREAALASRQRKKKHIKDLLSRPRPLISTPLYSEVDQRSDGFIQLPADSRYPGLILQPDSAPNSQDQLAAEVKGIYAGLVMVEAKCINIDAAQAKDHHQPLGPEQWQALIALHRTLLYEHHDFLMATQHPSASPSLRHLANKYNMPARMWKHGIHAFLEILRHRRPESQDYMLAFIYLAYQMMALLLETAPGFQDTWIECLGDLARYRMAIEEEKEAHSTWGGVAARWYTMASDRRPAMDRLYHHLSILERPSLRKFCLYAKSLSCLISRPNARASLLTLCGPIVQDKQLIHSSCRSAEASPLGDGWSSTAHYLNQLIFDGTPAEWRFPTERHGACTPPIQTPRDEAWDHQQGTTLPGDARTLPKDYLVHGLIWSQFYLASGWPQDESIDDTRHFERGVAHEARTERVLWLALYFAFTRDSALCYQLEGGFTIPMDSSSLTSKQSPTETRSSSSDSHSKSWILATLRALVKVAKSLLCSWTWTRLIQAAQAAPINMLELDETSANQSEARASITDWTDSTIEHKILLVVSAVLAIGSCINVLQVAVRKPETEPKMSGDLALGFSLIAWALLETQPSLTDLRNLLLALWLATESDFIARMCCLIIKGRVYFWTTIASGVFASLFLAALQSDTRPTLASMLLGGLPSAAFLISCAARVLPKAIGMK